MPQFALHITEMLPHLSTWNHFEPDRFLHRKYYITCFLKWSYIIFAYLFECSLHEKCSTVGRDVSSKYQLILMSKKYCAIKHIMHNIFHILGMYHKYEREATCIIKTYLNHKYMLIRKYSSTFYIGIGHVKYGHKRQTDKKTLLYYCYTTDK